MLYCYIVKIIPHFNSDTPSVPKLECGIICFKKKRKVLRRGECGKKKKLRASASRACEWVPMLGKACWIGRGAKRNRREVPLQGNFCIVAGGLKECERILSHKKY